MSSDGLHTSEPSRIHAWLQLLRAPNLFTVPGDPLAGYLLAVSVRASVVPALSAACASLSFYAAGLLMNDLADLDEDRRERPARPLPSEAVNPRTVWCAAVALALCGLGLCACFGALALGYGAAILLAVAFYNFWSKKLPFFGAVNMGVCRGLSVALGASFSGRISEWPLTAAAIIAGYIAAVTAFARHETRDAASWKSTFKLPAEVGVLGFLVFLYRYYLDTAAILLDPDVPAGLKRVLMEPLVWFAVFFLPAIFIAACAAWKIHKRRQPVPPVIGSLIRALIFVQAAFCAAALSTTRGLALSVGLGIVALWPLSRMASRRFYAS
jgi:4-hydroxybenzoate polyprenyltransferase